MLLLQHPSFILNIVIFLLFLTKSSPAIYNDLDSNELLKWCDYAATNLKIYIYPRYNYNLTNKCNQKRDYFKLEQKLPEYLKSTSIYTSNPNEADLFLITHDLVCTGLSKFNNTEYQESYMNPLFHNIITNPFYKRFNGSDHIFIYVCDNGLFCDTPGGACFIPDKYTQHIQNMILLGNYGYANTTPLTSNRVHPSFPRGCFLLNHDIVVPQFNSFRCELPRAVHQHQNLLQRDFLSVFWGVLVKGLECSPGSRQALKYLKHTTNSKDKRIFEFQNRRIGPRHSFFSFCPSGHACWSSRLYDAICSHSLPIIIAHGVIEPFERFFNWSMFTKMNVAIDTSTSSTVSHPINTTATHPIHPAIHKLTALLEVSPWFSWDASRNMNSWKLIVLELFCRTSKGKLTKPCLMSSSAIALKTYLFD
eukprot:gene8523-17584_t